MEIPARGRALAKLDGDPAVERMGAAADDPVFLGQREIDLVVGLAELFDLGSRTRLLLAEIVGRHAEHNKAARLIPPPQGFEVAVLRRVATERSRVDDKHRPAAPFRQGQLVAVDRDKLELVGVARFTVAHRTLAPVVIAGSIARFAHLELSPASKRVKFVPAHGSAPLCRPRINSGRDHLSGQRRLNSGSRLSSRINSWAKGLREDGSGEV